MHGRFTPVIAEFYISGCTKDVSMASLLLAVALLEHASEAGSNAQSRAPSATSEIPPNTSFTLHSRTHFRNFTARYQTKPREVDSLLSPSHTGISFPAYMRSSVGSISHHLFVAMWSTSLAASSESLTWKSGRLDQARTTQRKRATATMLRSKPHV